MSQHTCHSSKLRGCHHAATASQTAAKVAKHLPQYVESQRLWQLLDHCRRTGSQKWNALQHQSTHPRFRYSMLTRMIPHSLRVNLLHVYISLLVSLSVAKVCVCVCVFLCIGFVMLFSRSSIPAPAPLWCTESNTDISYRTLICSHKSVVPSAPRETRF